MDKEYTSQKENFGFKLGAEKFPLMCVVAVTYRCNAACAHCPYTNSDIRQSFSDAPMIDPTVFKKISDECGAHGSYVRITGGGEPMLHPNMVELIEYAKKVGAKVGMITNGSKFNEESLRRLLGCGIDMLELSADAADAETYAKFRQGLNFDALRHTVELAFKLRNQMKSSTKIVVSAVNQKGVDLDAVKRFWAPNVDNIIVRKYLTWGSQTKLNGEDSADPSPYLDVTKEPCPFPFERLNIDTRGEVIICGYDISSTHRFGNVKDHTIQEIWLGEKFSAWRKKHLNGRGDDIPLCRECPDWKYRSWTHNYWKVVRGAEVKRSKFLSENDMEGMADDLSSKS